MITALFAIALAPWLWLAAVGLGALMGLAGYGYEP